MPTLGPTAASTADADRAALHTTASGVPNEHVSRLRQWFCSCASTTITPAAERIKWYGKQTNCCIGSTERLPRAPARALTLMTMDEDNCSCFLGRKDSPGLDSQIGTLAAAISDPIGSWSRRRWAARDSNTTRPVRSEDEVCVVRVRERARLRGGLGRALGSLRAQRSLRARLFESLAAGLGG